MTATAGVKRLRKLLIGAEASTDPGTAVAATTFLRMNGVIADERETVHPDENVGILWGTDRSYESKQFATLEVSGEATFEQTPYVLQAGLYKTTPTTDTGSGLIWLWTIPMTDSDPIQSYTIEGGDNIACESISYGFVPSFNLTGEIGKAWMLTSTWNGQTATTDSFTTGLTLPDVEEILFTKTKLYIDDDTGTIGTTLVSQTLLNADLKMSLWAPTWTADGNLYFSFPKCSQPDAELKLTFEHNGSSVAEKAKWRTHKNRLIRLKTEGAALTSAGTYTYKTLIIDLAGSWDKFDKLSESDGNDNVMGTFKVGYNSTYGKVGQIIVVNELATLP